MQEERKVVREESTNITPNGSVVTEQAESTKTTADPKSTFTNLVWYIYGFIAIILSLRFVMKLAGANPVNAFVDFIYAISGVMSAPFDSIFGVEKASNGTFESVFEPSILVAIAVYALIAWGIAKFLTLNEPRSQV